MSVTEHMAAWGVAPAVTQREKHRSHRKESSNEPLKSPSPAEDRPQLEELGPGLESTLWLLFSLAASYSTFVRAVARTAGLCREPCVPHMCWASSNLEEHACLLCSCC